MIFTEDFLNEATFVNPDNLHKHYLDHVLQSGESFDPANPKFPYMTEEEYAKKAEELSLKTVGKSNDTVSPYIGFIVEGNRIEKIKTTSTIYKDKNIAKLLANVSRKYCDLVIYVDDEIRGHEIVTYMVGRPGKIFREKQHMISELTESYSLLEAMRELAVKRKE